MPTTVHGLYDTRCSYRTVEMLERHRALDAGLSRLEPRHRSPSSILARADSMPPSGTRGDLVTSDSHHDSDAGNSAYEHAVQTETSDEKHAFEDAVYLSF